MTPPRRRVALAALFAATAFGCATAPIGPAGRPIRASGTWLQPESGAAFPERIGALARTGATAWDASETNVGVGYGDGSRARITVYVYPAGDPFTGRLRGEFVQTEASLSELHPAALRDSGAVVHAPGPEGPAVGFEARFRLLASDGGQGTLAQVFQCGRWFLKLRATYAGDYAIDGALAAVHEQVRCADLAARTPIGTTGNIEYDPAGGPEWLVYGATQLVWLKEHVAPEALAFGIPDHEPGLFVESFEAMLDAREQAVASGGATPNPFLDRLGEIRAAGFLEAYVWRMLLGFLPPPHALARQLEAFESWRERALPAHRHEVYAGVRLVD